MKTPSTHLFRAVAAAGLMLAAGASTGYAAMSATAVTDLNVRAGPGPQYPTVGLATRGSPAVLDGCIQGSNWCRISVNGIRGWAYARYLATDLGGSSVVIEQRRTDLAIPSVTYQVQPGDPTIATTAEPLELIGPVEEVDAITPPPAVSTYITENPADTVYLEGEPVIGAALPSTVAVREIPDYGYDYVTINGQPVLVEPATRRIVYVYR
ncbi:DUF1236 domain-containing protein [Sinorhizobium terangae]|uniref:DUF1236 domain-containing protein n=1 Tax=Sinorhizobium terangae TaxID=110322 RepID=A0A6N7LJJ7_SINTE|nr:DUF1236 domain-containing protein [Sinorhizobium terangae]MBB4185366.1 uncharacterized protein YraI [Sinorhizobium terangae]MQX17399.1 DUF1236 domain-containing protein [Sinorhizobium terangae]WFU46556.1 DUF1236 domain-containing protein [Sinorhizobium terangae]